jgi:glycosyltransferase involved in cell wall biosynthesis
LKSLHVISFDVPFPANYGGVIDVFYKLKQLHQLGINIQLHCFEYGRGEQKELNNYCEHVYYYKRGTGILQMFSKLPYIVKTRISEDVVKTLLNDDFPILFEGLHTCGIIDDKRLEGRVKIYRESNIEHEYYRHLAKAEINIFKKQYFKLEANKLQMFESALIHATKMLVVSKQDTAYLQQKFPANDVEYLPSFHPYEAIVSKEGQGTYILYHGNLQISENSLAATFLIENVFAKINYPVKIAGLKPPKQLRELINAYSHIDLIENPGEEQLQQLINNAHINCLYTHQGTGLKLKLLNALFAGRHCLVNDLMLVGTGLEAACERANQAQEFIAKINELMTIAFEQTHINTRLHLLKSFNVKANAMRIKDIL